MVNGWLKTLYAGRYQRFAGSRLQGSARRLSNFVVRFFCPTVWQIKELLFGYFICLLAVEDAEPDATMGSAKTSRPSRRSL
jgi:hypothetical protein